MTADEGYFGERVAAHYDEHSARMFDPGGSRRRSPSAACAWPGIDNSEAMLDRLREKPGADRITTVAGETAATRVDGEFSLVYLVFQLRQGSGSCRRVVPGVRGLERGPRLSRNDPIWDPLHRP